VWIIELITKIFITNKQYTRCHINISICTFSTWQTKCKSPPPKNGTKKSYEGEKKQISYNLLLQLMLLLLLMMTYGDDY